MSGMFTLPLAFQLGSLELMIYPTVLQDEKELILVDCGYPFFLPKIEREMAQKGLQMRGLIKVIYTSRS